MTDLRSEPAAQTREFGRRARRGDPLSGPGRTVTADPALPNSPASPWRGTWHRRVRHDESADFLPVVAVEADRMNFACASASPSTSGAEGSVLDVVSRR